jgi:anti-anti-sigma regulatory factor
VARTREICDARGLSACTETVDELARLALAARREGRELWLWQPSPALLSLIEQMGLAEVLRPV